MAKTNREALLIKKLGKELYPTKRKLFPQVKSKVGAYVSGDLNLKEYHKKSPRHLYNLEDASSVIDL
jgi:hypothetical protein